MKTNIPKRSGLVIKTFLMLTLTFNFTFAQELEEDETSASFLATSYQESFMDTLESTERSINFYSKNKSVLGHNKYIESIITLKESGELHFF